MEASDTTQTPQAEEVTIKHPVTGQDHTIRVPADHDGSRIKVEFPEVRDEEGTVTQASTTAYTEGWDPAERALAGERPIVPCGTCGAPQTLTSLESTCSACGAKNRVVLQSASESAVVRDDGQV